MMAFVEKAAQRKSCEVTSHDMYLASMCLDLDTDTLTNDHGDQYVTTDLNEEQVWTNGSPIASTPPVLLTPTVASAPTTDASLTVDHDMVTLYQGDNTVHAQAQHSLLQAQSTDMHGSFSSLLVPSSRIGEPQYAATTEMVPRRVEALDPVQPLLHVAVRTRNCSMIAMLLQHGAVTVGDQDSSGATALHIAAESGDEATVSLLLRHGADVGVRDVRGQDALHLAVAGGHTFIVKLMLQKYGVLGEVSHDSPF